MQRARQQEPKKALLAINCLVYNHEPYLRQCLDGFVMQQTSFPFVAIVHDDASTDKSEEIIREYAEKYPDIIFPIYEKENQFQKGDGNLWRVVQSAIDTTDAKYIAVCEGDDYWIDPHKLQKQVDYLEAHDDCAVCCHQVSVLVQQTGKLKAEEVPYLQQTGGDATINDLCGIGNFIHTMSVVYRANAQVSKKKEQLGAVLPGDYPLWILSAEHGYIHKFEKIMAVYRCGSGIWSTQTNGIVNSIKTFEMLNRLRMLVENEEARRLLDGQIVAYRNDIPQEYANVVCEYRGVLHSHSYRLGKKLLKPVSWLRRIFTNI